MKKDNVKIKDRNVQGKHSHGNIVKEQTLTTGANQIGMKNKNMSFQRAPEHRENPSIPNTKVDKLPYQTDQWWIRRDIAETRIVLSQGQIDDDMEKVIEQHDQKTVIMKSLPTAFQS